MDIKALEQIGLESDEAKVYSTLVINGTSQARKVAYDSQINRSLVYKILKNLISEGLVVENESGSISTFSALHPSKLHSLVKKKEEESKLADHAFHEVVSTLGAQYNLTCGKPTIRFYEGLEGIKILNKDIIHTKSNIKLIRSPFDNNDDDLDKHAKNLIEERAKLNIHTKIIVPIKNTPSSISTEWDKNNLIERKRIPRSELLNPAQVIIYGNKVALTSFANCMITTIIEDTGITKTFEMLFDNLWSKYPSN